MITTVEYQGESYPAFQASGNAARFCRAFAQEVCQGEGYDIGCNRLEWALPGAIPVDLNLSGRSLPMYPSGPGGALPRLPAWYDNGLTLPEDRVDYIHSSHCLEHLPDWVGALDHWGSRLKADGTLFLYLPHPDQVYWRPFHNRKHIHSLSPFMIERYLHDRGYKNIFVSQRDMNHSFIAMAQK